MSKYKNLTILHSNDMHGDFLADNVDEKLVGGVSMLSGYVNKVRNENPNTLYCISGDMFRGSVIDSEFKGMSTIEIMNTIAPDVVTLGNHETDYGITHLLFLEKCAKFPIINANLYIKTNHTRLFNSHKIIEIDGMKILFIGIITENVMKQAKNEGIIGSFVDVFEASKEVGRICNAYNAEDIDLTILLTHIGFEEDKLLNPIIIEILKKGNKATMTEILTKAVEYMNFEIEIQDNKLFKVLPGISYTIVGITILLFTISIIIPCIQIYLGGFLFI